MAAVVALAALSLLPMARLAVAAADRARAAGAADAAALAGAATGPGPRGEAEARAVAAANGAAVETYRDDGRVVSVAVRRDDRRATARAERRVHAADSGRTGLHPQVAAALERAGALLGRPVPVSSGFRTRRQQEQLWARRGANPYPVARPGTSAHERGLAVDVPRAFVPTLLQVASRAGLCRPMPARDPVHFELCRGPVSSTGPPRP